MCLQNIKQFTKVCIKYIPLQKPIHCINWAYLYGAGEKRKALLFSVSNKDWN